MATRREALAAGALTLALGGCDRVISGASRWLGADLPERLTPPIGPTVSHARHLLSRAAFGPWPGDVELLERVGADAWIEEQLHPERIDDAACDVRAGVVDVAHVPTDLVFEMRPEHVRRQLVAHTLIRAVYSRRQLLEVMVDTWTDHFNVHMSKDHCRHLAAPYVRDVLRAHALGSFRELLRAVVLSPAMLVYLDGRDNVVGGANEVANENYARELLELHALGVRGGYAQRDVMEAARCLSGWVVAETGAPGTVRFEPSRHDDREKVVLGVRIPRGGGARDVDSLLDVVVRHPSCATHVATRLCRRLVSDAPPASLVRAAAARFTATEGDLREVLRTILCSEEFAAAKEARIKRPFDFVVGSLRALAADTHARGDLSAHLARMGQSPYDFPTPDGYPLEADAWLSTLLPRWRFALALVEGRLDDTSVDVGALRAALGADEPLRATWRHLVGRDPSEGELAPIAAYVRGGGGPDRALALVLASPAFQRC